MPWWMRKLICRIFGHDWHYGKLTNLDGTPHHFRSCMRCEASEPGFTPPEGTLVEVYYLVDDGTGNTDHAKRIKASDLRFW